MSGDAVILSGGGANGAYEIGVLEALFNGRWRQGREGPIEPTVFTGTSVGSFSAAFLVSRDHQSCLQAVRELRSFWLDQLAQQPGSRHNGIFRLRGDVPGYLAAGAVSENRLAGLLDLPHDVSVLARNWLRRGLDLTFSGDALGRGILRLLDLGDLISTTPLERRLDEALDVSRILRSDRTLKVVASNWDTGEVVVFRNRADANPGDSMTVARYRRQTLGVDNAKLAILASTAIPAVFPRIRIGDAYYVDGGVLMNTPLNPAIEAGASVLHVIHLEPRVEAISFGRAPSAFEAMERFLLVAPAGLVKADIRYTRMIRRLILAANSLQRTQGEDGQRDDQDGERVAAFLRDFAGRPELTLHRYFPSRRLGGVFGLLDFSRQRLVELIELGFQDTVEHDCEANGCIGVAS